MSEQEMISEEAGAGGPSVMVLEKSAPNDNNLYCPTELIEEMLQESYHMRSKAPTIPSVTDLKESTNPENKQQAEIESVLSSEKHKQIAVKKHSSHVQRRGSSPETTKMAAVEITTKKESITPSPQPIPVQPTVSIISSTMTQKAGTEKIGDDDSLTEEITELRTPEEARKPSEWSDEEEASGLPRSESRASRISRAMRQLFCCGVAYHAPSEGASSTPRAFSSGI